MCGSIFTRHILYRCFLFTCSISLPLWIFLNFLITWYSFVPAFRFVSRFSVSIYNFLNTFSHFTLICVVLDFVNFEIAFLFCCQLFIWKTVLSISHLDLWMGTSPPVFILSSIILKQDQGNFISLWRDYTKRSKNYKFITILMQNTCNTQSMPVEV